jgi:hypothetical protein
MEISYSVEYKKSPAPFTSPEWQGMVFIQTGGVLAGSAGYFFKWAGYRLDIGWVSQLMETQLAIIITY